MNVCGTGRCHRGRGRRALQISPYGRQAHHRPGGAVKRVLPRVLRAENPWIAAQYVAAIEELVVPVDGGHPCSGVGTLLPPAPLPHAPHALDTHELIGLLATLHRANL